MEKFISDLLPVISLWRTGKIPNPRMISVRKTAVPEEVIDAIDAQEALQRAAESMCKVSPVEEFVTEDYYRSVQSQWNSQEQIDSMIGYMERTPEGLLWADRAQLYGMESFALTI